MSFFIENPMHRGAVAAPSTIALPCKKESFAVRISRISSLEFAKAPEIHRSLEQARVSRVVKRYNRGSRAFYGEYMVSRALNSSQLTVQGLEAIFNSLPKHQRKQILIDIGENELQRKETEELISWFGSFVRTREQTREMQEALGQTLIEREGYKLIKAPLIKLYKECGIPESREVNRKRDDAYSDRLMRWRRFIKLHAKKAGIKAPALWIQGLIGTPETNASRIFFPACFFIQTEDIPEDLRTSDPLDPRFEDENYLQKVYKVLIGGPFNPSEKSDFEDVRALLKAFVLFYSDKELSEKAKEFIVLHELGHHVHEHVHGPGLFQSICSAMYDLQSSLNQEREADEFAAKTLGALEGARYMFQILQQTAPLYLQISMMLTHGSPQSRLRHLESLTLD